MATVDALPPILVTIMHHVIIIAVIAITVRVMLPAVAKSPQDSACMFGILLGIHSLPR